MKKKTIITIAISILIIIALALIFARFLGSITTSIKYGETYEECEYHTNTKTASGYDCEIKLLTGTYVCQSICKKELNPTEEPSSGYCCYYGECLSVNAEPTACYRRTTYTSLSSCNSDCVEPVNCGSGVWDDNLQACQCVSIPSKPACNGISDWIAYPDCKWVCIENEPEPDPEPQPDPEPDIVIEHSFKGCHPATGEDGDVYWFDSKGDINDIYQDCRSGEQCVYDVLQTPSEALCSPIIPPDDENITECVIDDDCPQENCFGYKCFEGVCLEVEGMPQPPECRGESFYGELSRWQDYPDCEWTCEGEGAFEFKKIYLLYIVGLLIIIVIIIFVTMSKPKKRRKK